jgi:hypothetical protein
MHDSFWWLVSFWYVLEGHSEQVRAVILVSGLISSPGPHVACAIHDSFWWLISFWYVLIGQPEQIRAVFLLSTLICVPEEHVV